jgi:beta-lactamase regulating signal transducer with metallopeptidase domain
MDRVLLFFPEETAAILGWTIIHSLWQATLISLLAVGVSAKFRQKGADFRYWTHNLALWMVLACSVATYLYLHVGENASVQPTETVRMMVISDAQPLEKIGFVQYYLTQGRAFLDVQLPYLTAAWLLGALFFALRLMGGLWLVGRLRSSAKSPLPEIWQHKIQTIGKKMGLRLMVRGAESALARVPLVIGHFKPLVIFPLGVINQLAPEQVEAILAHELAHIRRNDYLLNFLQSLVELLFYYHPAVWWISANIRAERENCCDDLAISITRNPLAYAKALVEVQALQRQTRLPALALPLVKNNKHLLMRVKRVLNQPQNKSNIMEKMIVTSMLFGILFLGAIGATLPGTAHEDMAKSLPILPKVTFDEMVADSLPPQVKRRRIERMETMDDNGRVVQMERENGRITKLSIDGKTIPASDYDKYKDIIDGMDNGTPTPPTPPMTPKSAERPDDTQHKETRIVIKQKGGSGNSTIQIDGENITIDGKPIDQAKGDYDIQIFKDNKVAENGQPFDWQGKGENGDMRFFHFGPGDMKIMMDSLQGQFKMFGNFGMGEEGPGNPFFKRFFLDMDSLGNRGGNFGFGLDGATLEDIQKQLDEAGAHFNGKWFGATEPATSPLEKALYDDGLVKKGEGFSLELTDKSMKLDGKEQPKSVQEKFKKLYLDSLGDKKQKNFRFQLEKAGMPKVIQYKNSMRI